MLVALASAEAEKKTDAVAVAEKKQDTNVETVKNKRGLFESLGDYGGHDFGGHDFGGHSFGGHSFGGQSYGGQSYGGQSYGGQSYGGHDLGHDFGASDHHHEHVKHVTVEKKIPVPYTGWSSEFIN